MGSVTPIEREPFVDAKVVAVHIGVHKNTVARLTREGIIPAHAVSAGMRKTLWRYRLSEVDEWMKNNASKSVDEKASKKSA